MSLCRNVWELLCGVHSNNNSHHRKAQIKYSNLPKRHNKLRLLVTRALCSISSTCGCCFSLQFFFCFRCCWTQISFCSLRSCPFIFGGIFQICHKNKSHMPFQKWIVRLVFASEIRLCNKMCTRCETTAITPVINIRVIKEHHI